MIVYRDRRRRVRADVALDEIRAAVSRLPLRPRHEQLVDLLIELGMLETGVADARHPDADDEEPVGRAFRVAMTAAGHLVRLSWHERAVEGAPHRATLDAALGGIAGGDLPRWIEIELPEGYAQYGLFPECYLVSAERCARELGRARYVCLGLRNIGTSLSALAAAALEAHGCEVRSYTLRPRGHPYDRQVRLGAHLRSALASCRDAGVLVVDEGPGLSGSSFAGTAEALNRIGIPDEHIVLLPSWPGDRARLRSAGARARWDRHRRYTTDFDEVWLRSGRLARALGASDLRDVSAGAWREALLPPGAVRPPVHPHHERRKLVTQDRLVAFAGLGGLAERRQARAASLAAEGYGPAPRGVAHGFLVRDLSEGVPLSAGEADEALLDVIGRYVAHLRACFPADQAAGKHAERLNEMVTTNVSEGLGTAGSRLLTRHRGLWGLAGQAPPVALDARMLPHEWLRTPGGYLKVDALDHHDDHFFPGPTDVAWDLAAAGVEFRLPVAGRVRLLDQYRRASGDRTIAARLPASAVAYLAFRLGYATMAAETLGDAPDGRGFAALATWYAGELHRELAATAAPRWSA